jgi:hypothetical protein
MARCSHLKIATNPQITEFSHKIPSVRHISKTLDNCVTVAGTWSGDRDKLSRYILQSIFTVSKSFGWYDDELTWKTANYTSERVHLEFPVFEIIFLIIFLSAIYRKISALTTEKSPVMSIRETNACEVMWQLFQKITANFDFPGREQAQRSQPPQKVFLQIIPLTCVKKTWKLLTFESGW